MRILTGDHASQNDERNSDDISEENKLLYLPHSAPRDFIMVSTPDLAHALGTTKPDPFKRQLVVTEQG